MKRITTIFLSVLVLFLVSAQAQTYTKPEKAIETMPLEGGKIENFVPKGWEIYSEAKGDLNGDGLADAAISIGLTEDMKEMLDTSDDNYESPPYIMVVLFGTEDGKYRRFAANGRLYPKYGNAAPTLEIKKDVLISNQNFRDGWALDVTLRFRYDPTSEKMLLIGSDVEHYNRADIYAGSKASENYLTGMRIEYAKSAGSRKSSAYSETKKTQIERSKTAFEDAAFDYEEQTFERVNTPSTPSVAPQGRLNGTWSWEGKPDKKKLRDTVWIDIEQTGNTVKGGISISAYSPDEEDGSDSPITPFIGTVNGGVITIEFDAQDTSPINGDPLPKYVRRRGGAPNTATLKIVGGKLEFTQTKGTIGKGYPQTFVLTRNK